MAVNHNISNTCVVCCYYRKSGRSGFGPLHPVTKIRRQPRAGLQQVHRALRVPHRRRGRLFGPGPHQHQSPLGPGHRHVEQANPLQLLHFRRAIRHLRRALVEDPEMQEAHDNLILCHGAVNEIEEAYAAFDASRGMNPRSPHCYFNAAFLRYDAGEHKLAHQLWARVVEIAPGSRANHSLTANGFSCEFAWEAEPGGAGPELQVLVASNGSFFGGGLPCRLCEMFRLPRSAPGGWDGSAPLSEWRPWWLTQAPLYRPHASTALSDLGGNITFRALSVTGGFRRGDIVLPIFAASEGGPGGASLELLPRGARLVKPEPVTQLQLLCEFQHLPLERLSECGLTATVVDACRQYQ